MFNSLFFFQVTLGFLDNELPLKQSSGEDSWDVLHLLDKLSTLWSTSQQLLTV